MSHSTWKIKLDNFARQSDLDRVSKQSNQQLIRPIKKLLLVEEDCKLNEKIKWLMNYKSWLMSRGDTMNHNLS